ncbi:MAG: 4Fe-4S binding protein [Firmicutes bacterium]|nr:4Fe-4S binding protein [Bacillota bacterium]
MIRKIIQIDESKCNGCGACAEACHEGAIGMIDGKAKLLRDDYCDGLGDCLPTCPTNAITFVEREAAAYDEEAVKENMRRREASKNETPVAAQAVSQLTNWPVQIKLAPINAPYFDGADLLIAADCSAYAYANFHNDFIRGKVTLIGCPKLDGVDYSEKLAAILQNNEISSLTVVRMQVPCCGGLEMAVKKAMIKSGKALTTRVVTISNDGRILD